MSEDPETRERQAAEYLVQQMNEVQDERERIAIENEQLHLQTQELIDETKRLGEDIQDMQQYLDNVGTGSVMDERGNGMNFTKMKSRIEELEDLLFEIQQNGILKYGIWNINDKKRV